MAQSLKNAPFTKLGDFSSVLDDDFCHGNIETIKVKGATAKGAQFNWKGKVKCTKKDFSDSSLTDELNFRFAHKANTFWFGSRRNGEIKAHADLGQVSHSNKDFNLFTNLKTTVDFKKFAFRFGVNHFSKNLDVSARFETGVNGSHAFTDRVVWRNNDITVGAVTQVQCCKWNLLRYDAFLKYNTKDFNATIKHESNNLKGEQSAPQLGTVSAFFNLTKYKNLFSLAWNKDFASQDQVAYGNFTAGVQNNVCPAITVKAKANSCGWVALAAKKKVNDLATVSLSAKVDLKDPSKALDFSKLTPFPIGYQVDFNV